MFQVLVQKMPGKQRDHVHVSRLGGGPCHRLKGRKAAIAYLNAKGCCQGATRMLRAATCGVLYEIAEPRDLSAAQGPSPWFADQW